MKRRGSGGASKAERRRKSSGTSHAKQALSAAGDRADGGTFAVADATTTNAALKGTTTGTTPLPASASRSYADQMPRALPWQSWQEWSTVRDAILRHGDPSAQRAALMRVEVWRIRGRLPHAVDATAQLVELALNDPGTTVLGSQRPVNSHQFQATETETRVAQGSDLECNFQQQQPPPPPPPIASTPDLNQESSNADSQDDHGGQQHRALYAYYQGLSAAYSERMLQSAYAMAVVRAVNGIVDAGQRGPHATSVAVLAQRAGLPSFVVDLRHDATHNALPALPVLRIAAHRILRWLELEYWDAQSSALVAMEKQCSAVLKRYMFGGPLGEGHRHGIDDAALRETLSAIPLATLAHVFLPLLVSPQEDLTRSAPAAGTPATGSNSIAASAGGDVDVAVVVGGGSQEETSQRSAYAAARAAASANANAVMSAPLLTPFHLDINSSHYLRSATAESTKSNSSGIDQRKKEQGALLNGTNYHHHHPCTFESFFALYDKLEPLLSSLQAQWPGFSRALLTALVEALLSDATTGTSMPGNDEHGNNEMSSANISHETAEGADHGASTKDDHAQRRSSTVVVGLRRAAVYRYFQLSWIRLLLSREWVARLICPMPVLPVSATSLMASNESNLYASRAHEASRRSAPSRDVAAAEGCRSDAFTVAAQLTRFVDAEGRAVCLRRIARAHWSPAQRYFMLATPASTRLFLVSQLLTDSSKEEDSSSVPVSNSIGSAEIDSSTLMGPRGASRCSNECIEGVRLLQLATYIAKSRCSVGGILSRDPTELDQTLLLELKKCLLLQWTAADIPPTEGRDEIVTTIENAVFDDDRRVQKWKNRVLARVSSGDSTAPSQHSSPAGATHTSMSTATEGEIKLPAVPNASYLSEEVTCVDRTQENHMLEMRNMPPTSQSSVASSCNDWELVTDWPICPIGSLPGFTETPLYG